MIRTHACGAALALAALLPAWPERAVAQVVVQGAAALSELDSETGTAVRREVERAAARGLPIAPLHAKAREGRLKRASGARIRQAVSALAVRLDSARSALGADASEDELVAGADAIAAGATPAALRDIRVASRQPSVSVALGALAQLVASGVPTTRATSMVVELLRRNATAAQLVAFGNGVESDAATGLPGAEAAAFRLRTAATPPPLLMTNSAAAISNLTVTATTPAPTSPPKRRP